MTEEEWDAAFDEGYLAAFAQLMSGEARLMEWDGDEDEGDPTCEACGQAFPASEYGVTLRDEVWAPIAPRPDDEYFGSGMLCLDCVEVRLGREVTPDDVKFVAQYGKRPTYRAAYLSLAFPLSFGWHLFAEDAGSP